MDNDETQILPYYQFTARLYDQLEKQGVATLTYSTTDSAMLIVQFMHSLSPILPVILTTFPCFDSIHEDRDGRVTRTLLLQPRKRICYLHQKIRTNLAALCVIFSIPLLLLSLCFGIFNHYERTQASVLSNVQGLTSLEQMENILAETEENSAMTYTLGTTWCFSIPYQTQSPNSRFDFSPMWQFMGWYVLMALLVILFCMLLNMLFNAIYRNKMTSLVLTLAILLFGMGIAQPVNTEIWYAWLPFTYFNPVGILSGCTSYTYLNGVLTLGISCGFLYVTTRWIFRKKDVV